MKRKNAAKNDSNFITRLLAFVLFVLALAMNLYRSGYAVFYISD